jgi:GNAT superfamily N-acetyltransferase
MEGRGRLVKGHHGVVSDLYRAGDEADILALNRMEYGPTDILATPADFNWRYAQNPVGQAIISVARDWDSGSVIGFIWIVPLRIRVSGEDWLGATGTNLLIHPDYRGTSAYVKLMRRFRQAFIDHDIPLHYSFISEDTYSRLRPDDPRVAFGVPLLIRPLDMMKLARAYFDNSWRRLIVGIGGQLATPLLFRARQFSPGKHHFTLHALDGFDDRFDDFWARVKDKYPIMVIRDHRYLAWRFAEVSGRQYRILVVQVGDEIISYTVLRCANIREIPIGLVMDLLVETGPRGEAAGACLMAEALRYFRSENMWLAGGLMLPQTAEYSIMRRAGYLPCPERLAPRLFRLAFRFHGKRPDIAPRLSPEHWFVTIADYEAY